MADIPSMTQEQISKVSRLEDEMRSMPQVDIPISHQIHGGVYSRTAYIPAGVMFTGTLIKIPTTIVICGDLTVYIGDQTERLTGYHVLAADAGRKQAFVSHSDSFITMLFPTDAETAEEAESEFTDEVDELQSRLKPNLILPTEVKKCLA